MSTLRKAADALRLLSAQGEISAKGLADGLKLSRSAAHRLVQSLAELGFIARDPARDGFVIGPLIGALASGQPAQAQLLQIAKPHMAALRERCNETIGLHILRGERRVLVSQEESRQEHRWVYNNLNRPMPLHAGAASKMLLAGLADAQVRAILRATDKGETRATEALLRELTRIGAQGYAISHQEVTPGIASIAVPIGVGEDAIEPPAVLSITGPRLRLSDAALTGLLPQLILASDRIAAEMTGAPRRQRASA